METQFYCHKQIAFNLTPPTVDPNFQSNATEYTVCSKRCNFRFHISSKRSFKEAYLYTFISVRVTMNCSLHEFEGYYVYRNQIIYRLHNYNKK